MFAVIDTLLLLAAFYVFITQMLLPTIKGTRWFPMFLKESKLSSELTDVNQKAVEQELEQKITTFKKKRGL